MQVFFSEILKSWTPEKRRWDATYPWLYFVIRPVSFPVTWGALRLNLTANQVTFLSFVSATAGIIFFTFGYSNGFLWGSILILSWAVLDCVDGNIARLKGSSGPAGKFFDVFAAYPYQVSYLFLGIGLFHTPDLPFPPLLFLVLGFLATICKLLVLDIRRTFTHLVLHTSSSRQEPILPGPHVGRWYYRIYYSVTDMQGHDGLILLAALTHHVGLFLILSTLVQAADLIFTSLFYWVRVSRLEK